MKIEKGIPYPIKAKIPYPFPAMEVGDSFLVDESSESSVRSSANAFGRKYGCKFSILKTPIGLRCWRIV